MNQNQSPRPDFIPLTFGLESLFPPMALPTPLLRQWYMQIADSCRFSEFRHLGEGQGARLAESNNRFLTLTPDRLIYRDDFSQSTFVAFLEDMEHILNALRDIFHIPVLLHSKILLRVLMPLPAGENAASYIQKSMVNAMVPYLSHYHRPLQGIGIRLVFPPTQELHSTFHLRIEPYYRDPQFFFLENSAQFFDPLIRFADMKLHFQKAYDFLKDEAGPFLLALQTQ